MPQDDSTSLPNQAFPIENAYAARNIIRLTIAQALAGANAVVIYATGAIVGNTLSPNHSLATLPITIFVLGMTLCSLPAGAIAQRFGRRVAFMAGTGCGVLVGLLSALALVEGLFWLFCVASLFGGAYAAVCFPSVSLLPIAFHQTSVLGRCLWSWPRRKTPRR